jgi:4-amino-4-deoxy-L-arabinose transferase-like glycosyltransferase
MIDTHDQQTIRADKTVPAWTRLEIGFLSVFLCLVVFFRVINLSSYDVLSADGTSYGPIGQSFFRTGDFKVFGFLSGPGYSFFVGLFNLFFSDIETSLRVTSLFFSSMTVGVVYCMARAFYNRQSAVAAALLCATLPFLHGMSGIDITEPTFTFFLLAGVFVFWKAYTECTSLYAAVAGLLLVVSYLTRSEGFITWFALSVFAGIDLGLRFRQDSKRLFLRVMVPFWLTFMLFFAPYLVYLHNMTGEWHLSGKAAGNAQVIKSYLGLNPDGVDVKFRFKNTANGFDNAEGQGLGKLLREEPAVFFYNIRKNLSELPGAFSGAMPWYLLLAAAAALIVSPWQRRDLYARACIISICSPLVIYILFFVQQRGFHPYVSALCVVSGAGICLTGRLLGKYGLNTTLQPLIPLAVLVIPLTGYYAYLDYPREKPPYHFSQDGARRDDKHIGQRLKKVLPPDAYIMTRSGRIAFYAERPFLIPPQESYSDIMAYAFKNKVTHLIVTPQIMDMRPQLHPLFAPIVNPGAPFVPPPEVNLLYAGREAGGLPYLVYQLVPAFSVSQPQ